LDTLPGSSTTTNIVNPAETFAEQESQKSSFSPEAVSETPDGPEIGPTGKVGKGARGILDRTVAAYQEWKALQRQIQAHAAMVAKKEWDVQERINTYRMILSGVSFKSQKADREIWGMYTRIHTETPVLTHKTLKTPLFLHDLKRLREFEASWRARVGLQDQLLDTLAKAPKAVEFYNRIHLARIKKREQELKDTEIARRNAQAREAIEVALRHFAQPNDNSGVATLGSTILKLDEAQKYWNQRLGEIATLVSSARMDPEELITVFRNLQDTIADAPAMAERVKEVEVTFIRMMSMHEELTSYGKNVIPSEDLARMLIIVQDEIPRLWATGAWDKLRRSLNDVSSFVKFYELPVRSELSLAERRKPGLTRALLMGANNMPISQATPLIRSLVSAIDSRDRYMRGHSDTVARLVVQIAKKMNWSGDDLELLEIAALLHDVGKIAIPENVLTKIEPLTPDEWKTIQMHPYHGARIVKSLETLNRIIPWIYHHQEHYDGGGYPDGLTSGSIPQAARIIALGEAYTVMITDQPKRKALTIDQAVNEIQRGAGSQFDPEVVEAFSDSVNSARSEAAERSKTEAENS